MWTRYELKDRAKIAFRANYLYCVLVSLILLLISGGLAGATGSRVNINVNDGGSTKIPDIMFKWDSLPDSSKMAISGVLLGAAGLGIVLSVVVTIFLRNPATVGCRRFFFMNTYSPGQLNEVGWGFSKENYKGVVSAMFRMDLSIFLWSLLLVIPGIVKGYAYRMVPYILSEEPNIDPRRAMDISSEMMMGNKWGAFVLDLSFIGWYILAALTLGLLDIFWVSPYYNATHAELYRVLRERYQH
ncbi:MAG: DUF975 family protein [Firmicutes bacterium]|nr:DUF975 family protein [Bacillota bacterium]